MNKLKEILIEAFATNPHRNWDDEIGLSKEAMVIKRLEMKEHIDDIIIEIEKLENEVFVNTIRELLKKIPSDDLLNEYGSKYADAYYQGRFDVLMDLLRKDEEK